MDNGAEVFDASAALETSVAVATMKTGRNKTDHCKLFRSECG